MLVIKKYYKCLRNRFSSLIEISEYDIKLENKIGGGNFGEVFKGLYTYKNTCLEVAIKVKQDLFVFRILFYLKKI